MCQGSEGGLNSKSQFIEKCRILEAHEEFALSKSSGVLPERHDAFGEVSLAVFRTPMCDGQCPFVLTV